MQRKKHNLNKKEKKEIQKRANTLNMNIEQYLKLNINDKIYEDILLAKLGHLEDITPTKFNIEEFDGL